MAEDFIKYFVILSEGIVAQCAPIPQSKDLYNYNGAVEFKIALLREPFLTAVVLQGNRDPSTS